MHNCGVFEWTGFRKYLGHDIIIAMEKFPFIIFINLVFVKIETRATPRKKNYDI